MGAKRINQEVEVKDIHFDEGIYPRTGYNWQTGYDYAQSMLAGAVFPPIVLAKFRNKLYLIDGKHRLEATKSNKKPKIDATIHFGWSYNKMFVESVKYNITHGKVLSPYEKRVIAVKLKAMKYQLNEVSEILNIPMDKVETFVAQRLVNSITGETISETIVKSAIKHVSGTNVGDEQELEEQQKSYYTRDQVSLLKHLINLIKNKMLDTENEDVRELAKELKIQLSKY